MGLVETSLPQEGKIWQIVNVLTPDRSLGESGNMRIRDLMEVFFGHQAGEAKGAEKQTAPLGRKKHDVLTGTVQVEAAPFGTDDGPSLHDPPQEGQRTT